MTRKRGSHNGTGKKAQPRKSGSLPTVEWFNPKPNSDDLRWLEDRGALLLEDFIQTLDSLSEDERFTLKYDVHASRWLAIIFVGDGSTGETVHAMSVRGATPIDAAGYLAYCHRVRFADGWRTDPVDSDSRFG